MPAQPVSIESFLQLTGQLPVIDVRSPGEYSHAHIPGAFTLPIFNDLQRKTIGTAYKKQSREIAVNIGLNYFSERMKKVLPEATERRNGFTGSLLAWWHEKRYHRVVTKSVRK